MKDVAIRSDHGEHRPGWFTFWHGLAFSLSVVIGYLILDFALSGPPSPADTARQLIAQIESGHEADAARRVESLPSPMKDRAAIRYLAAYAAYRQGDLRRARNELKSILIGSNPSNLTAYPRLVILATYVELCLELGEEELVSVVFTDPKLLRFDPRTPKEYLAATYIEMYGHDEIYLRMAMTIAPEFSIRAPKKKLTPLSFEPVPERRLFLGETWDTSYALNRLMTRSHVRRISFEDTAVVGARHGTFVFPAAPGRR